MSLNESIVEDAALEWFEEPGYAVGHGPQLAPGEPAAKPACASHAHRRNSISEVVQFRFATALIPAFCLRPSPLSSGSRWEKEEDREAIRRPAGAGSAIPEEARATIRKFRTAQFPTRGTMNP